MSSPRTLASVTAPLNCDCVEVGPDGGEVFVGMYNYDEQSSVRGGGFLMMQTRGDIVHTHTSPDFGVLDAVWASFPDHSKSCIFMACSDGMLRVFDSVSSTVVFSTPVTNNAGTAANTENILMAVSTNSNLSAVISAKGQLVVLDKKNFTSVLNVPNAHDPVIESWTCALAPEAGTVATGADDCCLKLWDIRSGENTLINKKSHQTGVTTLKFMSDTELLTGSYDERIRRFDIRNLSQPITEVRSIGGIWRIKPHNELLFVAACYGGCQVVSLDDFRPVSGPFIAHNSMAYGISPINDNTAISCSFYDRAIQIWQF